MFPMSRMLRKQPITRRIRRTLPARFISSPFVVNDADQINSVAKAAQDPVETARIYHERDDGI